MKNAKLPLILGLAGSLVALGLGYGLGKALPGSEPGSSQETGKPGIANGTATGHAHQSALGQGAPIARVAAGEGLPASISRDERWGLRELIEFGMDVDSMRWSTNPTRTPPLLELAQHVNPADIPQLLDQLDDHLPRHKAQRLEHLLFSIYARAAPAKAWDLAWAREEQQGRSTNTAYYVINEWLQIAPFEALQAARAVMDDGENEQYFINALRNLAHEDPMFVWRELEEVEGLEEHRKAWARGEVLSALSEQDPQKAIALLHTVDDDKQRSRMISQIAWEMAGDDLDEALKFIQGQGKNDYEKRQANMALINNFVYRDVETAMDLYTRLGGGQIDPYIGSSIAQKLAEDDPEHAWEWIQGLSTQSYENALKGFARKMDPDDPMPVLQKLLSIPEENIRQNALNSGFQHLAREDPEKALELLEKQGLQDEAKSAWNQVFREWGSKDGPSAAQRIMELARGQEDFPEQLARQVVHGWAQTNPRKALEWTLQLPEDKQPDLVEVSISSWATHDLQGAGEWINTLGDGDFRDQAVEGFLQQVHRIDNIAAMEWAGTITDENLRERQLMNMGRNWKRIDRQGAMAWARANDLPEKVRDELLKEDD
jgi:hypothetical protein